MAFRNDIQGGHNQYGLVDGGQGLAGVPGVATEAKWKMAFFAGAVTTLVAAIISVGYFIIYFQWAPCSFASQLYLLIFAILMIILDAPVPESHYRSNPQLSQLRLKIYTYLLFLTRFTGRGAWYLFLSSMVFVALWDENINKFLGIILSLILLVIGCGATAKGVQLTLKLQTVRNALISGRQGPEQFIGHNQPGLSKNQFTQMVEKVTNQPQLFTSDDLDHVINALSFKPDNDGIVSLEEFQYWLGEGRMLVV